MASDATFPRRYEIKYHVSDTQARAIEAAIRPYCDIDPMAGEAGYTISTLYLDSPDLKLYWEKKLLCVRRTKARVRTYGMRSDGPVFVELKKRFNDVGVKPRASVPPDAWQAILDPRGDATVASWGLKESKAAVVEEFRAFCLLHDLRPLVVVRYDRLPFVGKFDERLRITFDRGLRCRPADRLDIPKDDRGFLFFDTPKQFAATDSRVILEIKYDMRYPLWVRDIVRRFELWRESFSKFVNSVDAIQDARYPAWNDPRRPTFG